MLFDTGGNKDIYIYKVVVARVLKNMKAKVPECIP